LTQKRKKTKKTQIRVWCRYFLAQNILRSWKEIEFSEHNLWFPFK
jgi:hypothetical protein